MVDWARATIRKDRHRIYNITIYELPQACVMIVTAPHFVTEQILQRFIAYYLPPQPWIRLPSPDYQAIVMTGKLATAAHDLIKDLQ